MYVRICIIKLYIALSSGGWTSKSSHFLSDFSRDTESHLNTEVLGYLTDGLNYYLPKGTGPFLPFIEIVFYYSLNPSNL